jgi:hypothetical protein
MDCDAALSLDDSPPQAPPERPAAVNVAAVVFAVFGVAGRIV